MRSAGRNPTSDFVQDYAAKRQAQLERAKQIREERLQQQQHQPTSSSAGSPTSAPSRGVGAGDDDDDGGSGYSAPTRHLAQTSQSRTPQATAHTHRSGPTSSSTPAAMLYVCEDDLKNATQAGVITPDQARQLWAMLSNQIIRIGRETETPTTSVNSLLALSHNGDAFSSTVSSLSSLHGGAGGVAFGAVASLDRLRQSIAQFKHENGRQPGRPQPSISSSPSAVAGAGLGERRGLAAQEPEAPPPLRGPAGIRASKKPAWSMDVDVDHGDDDAAYDPLPPMATDPFDDETDSGFGGRGGHQPPARRQGGRAGAAARAPTKKPTTTAPASRTGATRNSNLPQQQQQQQAPRAAMGVAPGVGLDDVPVGRGQSSAMTDWANAYPPGTTPPSSPSRGGGGGLSHDAINAQIEAESAAAAAEPLRECGYCGRRFRQSLLSRHETICKKSQKPRKTFDMKAQRADGVEGLVQVQREAKFQQRGGGRSGAAAAAPTGGGAGAGKIPKWKLQHEQFQAAMKSVQQINKSGGFGSGAPLPPPPSMPSELDDRVPCPHCGRKFAEDVAARHIPKCATTVAKPKGIRPIRR